MEPYIALLLVLIIALGLGYWAAYGGEVGRWVAAALLVGWVLWVGDILIGQNVPHLDYTPEERVYMDRLAKAVETGRTRVPLRELVPFEWSAMCLAEHLHYNKARKEAHDEVMHATGEDVLKELELNMGEGQRIMIFATPKGPVLVSENSEDLDKQLWVELVQTKEGSRGCGVSWDVNIHRVD